MQQQLTRNINLLLAQRLAQFEIPSRSQPKPQDQSLHQHRSQDMVRLETPLQIAWHLGGFWRIFFIFKLIPKWIRDRIYDWIASNRYRWFGKKESCMIPTPELKQRFL